MMKKSVLLWAILAISLSLLIRAFLIIRYNISHEIGIDSFFYHIEANVLLSYHRFTWWLHPLSFFGWYPYSDSPGLPTYIAMFSSLSGIPIESCVLIYSFFIISFGTFTMYILILKIGRGNLLLAFLISTIYGVAPILLSGTIWGLGERESVVYMIPQLSLMILYHIQEKDNINHLKIFILIITYFFILLTIHLISIFLYSLFLALIVNFFYMILKKHISISILKWKNMHKLKMTSYILISVLSIYSLFIVDHFFTLPYAFSIKNYENSALISGTDPLTILLNMGISYSGGIGILFPLLFPIGFLYLIYKRNDNFKRYFLWVLILSLPITINRLYSRPIMVFIGTIIMGYGLIFILKKVSLGDYKFNKKSATKKMSVILAVFFIILSAFFSYYMFVHWGNNFEERYAIKYSRYASPSTYEIGVYQKYIIPKIWISNDWLTAQRIQAFSNVPTTPSITGSPLLYNPAYYSLVNISVLKISKNNKFFLYTIRLYYSEYYFEQTKDYSKFMHSKPGSRTALQIIDKYNINYIIINNLAKNGSLGYHSNKVYPSKMIMNLPIENYKIFSNDLFSVFNA